MEVGQAYVLNTFDFGGVKALPLISKCPDKYKKHVIISGLFHKRMNYLGMMTGNRWLPEWRLGGYLKVKDIP